MRENQLAVRGGQGLGPSEQFFRRVYAFDFGQFVRFSQRKSQPPADEPPIEHVPGRAAARLELAGQFVALLLQTHQTADDGMRLHRLVLRGAGRASQRPTTRRTRQLPGVKASL